MYNNQLLNSCCLIFKHCIKTQGNEPKFIFFDDLTTTLSTCMVDIIKKILQK